MTILFITPTVPFPANSGIGHRIRINLETLAAVGQLTLFGLGQQPASAVPAGLCTQVVTWPKPILPSSPKSWVGQLKSSLKHLGDLRPHEVRQWDSCSWQEIFRSLHPEKYDLIWVQGLGLYGQLLPYDLPRVAVDLPDADFYKAGRDLRGRPWNLDLALAATDYWKLRRAERKWEHDGHWFVVCSEIDRQRLARKEDRVAVVRNAVEAPAERTDSPEASTLTFVGALAYKPNREAALYFVGKIFPRILEAVPEAHFSIIGSSPPVEIEALAQDSHVTVTGFVNSLDPYLRRASVAVAPLLNGCGTRLKILEAMSYGKPVVATSLGAEGLSVEHAGNIFLADNPDQFAGYCIELLRDPLLRSQIGGAGRQFVQSHHSIEHAQRDLRDLLERAFSIRTDLEILNGKTASLASV
jgi:glycosyltransferase involved in cell wall biosynthesis